MKATTPGSARLDSISDSRGVGFMMSTMSVQVDRQQHDDDDSEADPCHTDRRIDPCRQMLRAQFSGPWKRRRSFLPTAVRCYALETR